MSRCEKTGRTIVRKESNGTRLRPVCAPSPARDDGCQANIAKPVRFVSHRRAAPQGLPWEMLEPYEGKLSRTVLRGERGGNAPDLPGIQPY